MVKNIIANSRANSIKVALDIGKLLFDGHSSKSLYGSICAKTPNTNDQLPKQPFLIKLYIPPISSFGYVVNLSLNNLLKRVDFRPAMKFLSIKMCNGVNFIVLVLMLSHSEFPNELFYIHLSNHPLFLVILFCFQLSSYFPVGNTNFNFSAFSNGGAIARFVLFLKAPSILSAELKIVYLITTLSFLVKHKLIAKSFEIETINKAYTAKKEASCVYGLTYLMMMMIYFI